MFYRYCELCGHRRDDIHDYGACAKCSSRLTRLGREELNNVWEIPMGDSGYRYCQRCSRRTFVKDVERPNPCIECGGSNFDIKPKPHVGVLRCWYLTAEDRIFLRCQRIQPEDD